MSELTPCNLCTLRSIEAHAKRTGRVVTLVAGRAINDPASLPGDTHRKRPSSEMRGTAVLIHRADEAPDEKLHWAAWMWVIPKECAC